MHLPSRVQIVGFGSFLSESDWGYVIEASNLLKIKKLINLLI